MPFATFTKVREVSSEDSIHLADNLIKTQPGKKWKTKNAGEKLAYVILEMSESHQITGIDIGNEHAAFIEVFVGKSNSAPQDFTDILITCSFMTPPESKSSTNTNRVRCFNQEALVPTAAANKWSLVKIVCTQPFNRHIQYGLSFIKIHIAESQSLKTASASKNLVPEKFLNKSLDTSTTLSPFSAGKLKFRKDSSDSETEGALFNRWKNSKDSHSEPITTAASIRSVLQNPKTLAKDSHSEPTTTAASIRSVSQNSKTFAHRRLSDIPKPQTSRSIEKDAQPILDRNRDNLLFGDDSDDDDAKVNGGIDAKKERLTKQIEADKERLRLELEKQSDKNKRKSLDSTGLNENKEKIKRPVETNVKKRNETEKTNQDRTNIPSTSKILTDNRSNETIVDRTKKRPSSPTERPSKKTKTHSTDKTTYRPFNQLLSGVVLVISGIQNPDRADLRNKALALGAKYKGDWDQTCTHLICAFKNTPKYNQVRGKGKIITRSWIEKCYKLKKYLPWRRYALDSMDVGKQESDEEILDETLKPQNDENSNDSDLPSTSRRESQDRNHTLALYDADDQPSSSKKLTNLYSYNSDSPSTSRRESQDRNHTLALYDVDDQPSSSNKMSNIHPSASSETDDTDDEIQRIELAMKASVESKGVDIFEVTTDEEDYLQDKLNQVNSLNFFKFYKFFICFDIGSVDKIKLEKLIKQYSGTLTTKISEAQYVITTHGVTNADASISGEIVRPHWIYECHDLRTKLPTNRYVI